MPRPFKQQASLKNVQQPGPGLNFFGLIQAGFTLENHFGSVYFPSIVRSTAFASSPTVTFTVSLTGRVQPSI